MDGTYNTVIDLISFFLDNSERNIGLRLGWSVNFKTLTNRSHVERRNLTSAGLHPCTVVILLAL